MGTGTQTTEPEPPKVAPGMASMDEDAAPKGRRKGISEKRIKVAVVVIVVVVLVTVLLWGMVPDRIYEVKEVYEMGGDLDGERINVKGVVLNWEAGRSNFTIADSGDETLTIEVTHSGAIPEGFGINVTAIIKGVIHKDGDTYRMDSDEIQVGCPSKY